MQNGTATSPTAFKRHGNGIIAIVPELDLADLIAHGLTCGKGYTDEPLLQAIASPSITVDRLHHGRKPLRHQPLHRLADILLGDPLCCLYFAARKSD